MSHFLGTSHKFSKSLIITMVLKTVGLVDKYLNDPGESMTYITQNSNKLVWNTIILEYLYL